MGNLIQQPHGGALNILSKGESGNPNGRPKRIYTVLRESGYSKEDIKDAFEEIGWQTEDDIADLCEDKSKPLIVRLIARAFLKGTEKGDFRYVSEILTHVLGKPKETIDATLTKKSFRITLNINKNDRE